MKYFRVVFLTMAILLISMQCAVGSDLEPEKDSLTTVQKLNKAKALKAQGSIDEALTLFEDTLLSHPDILAYDDGGLLDDLKIQYDTLLSDDNCSTTLLLKAADIYLCLSELEKAITIYERTLEQVSNESDKQFISKNIARLKRALELQKRTRKQYQVLKKQREDRRRRELAQEKFKESVKELGPIQGPPPVYSYCGNCGGIIRAEHFSLCPHCHKDWKIKVSKTCGNCDKSVPSSTQLGDHCPHCGAIFSSIDSY